MFTSEVVLKMARSKKWGIFVGNDLCCSSSGFSSCSLFCCSSSCCSSSSCPFFLCVASFFFFLLFLLLFSLCCCFLYSWQTFFFYCWGRTHVLFCWGEGAHTFTSFLFYSRLFWRLFPFPFFVSLTPPFF